MSKVIHSKLLLALLFASLVFLIGCTQQEKRIDMNSLISAPAGIIGSENAPVTVVEYSDYQCPFCRKWFDESKKQLVDEYVLTGKVRFIFKDFPLSGHPLARPYAVSVRCAGEEGRYFDMHDKMYLEQGKLAQGKYTIVSVGVEDILEWAGELGLDINAYSSCLTSGKFDAKIGDNFDEAVSIGVNGTPSFVIGKTNGEGVLVTGAIPYSSLKSKIDELLR